MNASYDAIGGTIHCLSAPQTPHSAAVEVSLNAQQYTSNSVRFTYYTGPTVSLVTPDAGPTSGDTLVRLLGYNLDAGSEYRCRFGETVVRATIAHPGDANDTLRCVAPAGAAGPLMADGTRAVSLEVSLNSQNYTSDGLTFTYYEPPSVTSLAPTNGMFYGKTFVEVHGSALRHQWPDLQCRFGNTSSAHYNASREKWYGNSVVRGTYRDGVVRCVTPTSAQSGAARLMSITFGPTPHMHPIGCVPTLRGSALVTETLSTTWAITPATLCG